jgi:hypothetical protein
MPFGAFAPMPLRLGGSSVDGVSPEQHARLCADMVAVKRVAPLATWRFSCDASTATVDYYVGQNGSGLAYAPTATRNGNGDVSFVWDDPYFEDEYGIQHPFLIRAVMATSAGTAGTVSSSAWEIITRGVRIRRVSDAGAQQVGISHVTVW